MKNKENNKVKIGKILKRERVERGLTQVKLSEILSINRVNYCRYETDVNQPTITTLINLADYYGITVDKLIGRE
ncbi:MAG: helix-turn-helix transcriptional regulator [Bacillota bacterium]